MQQLKKVTKDIQNGKFSPVYLLYGTETFLMEEFLKFAREKMVDEKDSDMCFIRYSANETMIEDVIQDAETMPFLAERKVVVVTDCTFLTADKGKLTHDTDELLRYVESPAEYTSLFLLVDAEKMDQRKKLVKVLQSKATVIPFLPLKEKELYTWIEKRVHKSGLIIGREQAIHLVSIVGNNLRTLQREIEKFSLYLGGTGVVTDEVINLLSTPALERDVFKLIEAIVAGNVRQAFRMLYDCLITGEEPIKLMALIARQFRLLLLVKAGSREGKSLQEIAEITKVSPYVIKKVAEQSSHFSEESLRKLHLLAAEEDFRMKTGKIDKRIAIEIFISRVADELLSQEEQINSVGI